jgi:terminase small subunit-like protein
MAKMDNNNKMRTRTPRPRTGKQQQSARLVPEACAAASAFAANAEAAVADLEERRPLGIGPLERALAARVRSAAAQLHACAHQIERDGLMVSGSMGQDRAHPLLKVIADLRRELADALKELTFRVEQAEMIERMNKQPRKEQLANKEMTNLVLATLLQTGSEAEAAADRPSRRGSV